MQKAAEEMLAHHQQLATLEQDRHTVMLHNMQVAHPLPFSVTSLQVIAHLRGFNSSTLLHCHMLHRVRALCRYPSAKLLILPIQSPDLGAYMEIRCVQQAELQRRGNEMASRVRQHEVELASKAADMAAVTQQHGAALRQAAENFKAELAAASLQRAQQLQQAQAAAEKEAADADERLQDVKDLLLALQARFNNRYPCHAR